MENFRPIAHLAYSENVEHCVLDKFENFITKREIPMKNQFAFCKKRSTIENIRLDFF